MKNNKLNVFFISCTLEVRVRHLGAYAVTFTHKNTHKKESKSRFFNSFLLFQKACYK